MANNGTNGSSLPDDTGAVGGTDQPVDQPGNVVQQGQAVQPPPPPQQAQEINLVPVKRVPHDLINHIIAKEFTVAPLSPADFIAKHSSAAVDLAGLFARFNEICGDFDDIFNDPKKGRLCIGFCSDIIFDVGPDSRKSKSGDNDKCWCFTFNFPNGEQRYAYVATFRKNQVGTQGLAAGNAIYLTIKQASLIAVEVLCRLVTCVMRDNLEADNVVLTPLAGAIFSRNDMRKMAELMEVELDVMVNIVNRSCQSGSQYFPKGQVSAEIAVVAAVTSTRNMKNAANRLTFIVRTLKQFTSNHHPFDPLIVPQIVVFANCGLPNGMTPEDLLKLCSQKDEAMMNMKDLMNDLKNQSMSTIKKSNLPGPGNPGFGGGGFGFGGRGGGTAGADPAAFGARTLGGRGIGAASNLAFPKPTYKGLPMTLEGHVGTDIYNDGYYGLPSEYPFQYNNEASQQISAYHRWMAENEAKRAIAAQKASLTNKSRDLGLQLPKAGTTNQPPKDRGLDRAAANEATGSWVADAAKHVSSDESMVDVVHQGESITVHKNTKRVVDDMDGALAGAESASPDYDDAAASTEQDDEESIRLCTTVHTHTKSDVNDSDIINANYYKIPTSYLDMNFPRFRIAQERKVYKTLDKVLESREYRDFVEMPHIKNFLDTVDPNRRETAKLFLFRAGFSGEADVASEVATGNLNIPAKWRGPLGLRKADLLAIYKEIADSQQPEPTNSYARALGKQGRK